ncbi:MAG: DUF2520 domain-containing protein [Candidatus Marinimicrobia bacterium]|nr:DUF2520 domain-containing protein [Candidatus Neomarinimicrobiota bacterium]
MNNQKPQMSFSLFGASRIGIALAYQLHRIGYKPEFVWNRHQPRLNQAIQFVPFANQTTELATACRRLPNLIIIAVADDAIESVATQISQCAEDFSRVMAFHTSGFLNSKALEKLELKGAVTGSLHPVVSVPDVPSGIRLLERCIYTCEGAIKNSLMKLVTAIGAKPYALNRRQKEIVHLSAVFLNNYIVALVNAIKNLGADHAISPDQVQAILRPISEQGISSGWEKSIAEALTGPLIRGDFKTIEKHLDLLSDNRELKALYQGFIDLILRIIGQPPR